jgi:hypothetical protein
MKIDGTLSGQTVEKSGQSSVQSSGQTSGTDGDAFAALLQTEVQSAGETTGQESALCGSTSVANLLSLQSIVQSSAVQSSAQPSQATSSQAISSLSTVLDGLDSLQNALQGTKSPKEINSLIDQINQQAAGLDDKTASLPADSGLRDLAEETKVTAYMESMKWKRGDYL